MRACDSDELAIFLALQFAVLDADYHACSRTLCLKDGVQTVGHRHMQRGQT